MPDITRACPHCGAAVGPAANFCPACGARFFGPGHTRSASAWEILGAVVLMLLAMPFALIGGCGVLTLPSSITSGAWAVVLICLVAVAIAGLAIYGAAKLLQPKPVKP